MSTTITISDEIARHIDHLDVNEAGNMNEKIQHLLKAEYRRRLANYRLTEQHLTQKYGMDFNEFERKQMTKQLDYSWEVESDAIAWESAVDGIATTQRQFIALSERANDH